MTASCQRIGGIVHDFVKAHIDGQRVFELNPDQSRHLHAVYRRRMGLDESQPVVAANEGGSAAVAQP